MTIFNQISESLQQGKETTVFELTRKAIQEKNAPRDILDQGLIAGMNVVGEKFKRHEIFLPHVLLAAKAMHAGMEQLKPLLIQAGIPTLGKVVIGTIQGDLHDIGKNLVGIILKGAGFEVIDLGKNVAPDKFVKTAIYEQASIIGVSALLTTTMSNMEKVILLLKERKVDHKIMTIIGGAPASKEYAKKIGADAYAYDASNAVDVVKELVSSK